MTSEIRYLIIIFIFFILLMLVLQVWAHNFSLNIKSKRVGDGQCGAARWATEAEKKKKFKRVRFEPEKWRRGENLPDEPGVIVSKSGKNIYIDPDDIHALMVAAAGAGKTTYWLYPQLEYICACGQSFFCTDTKGDIVRVYGQIAANCYNYSVAVIDLRNPTRSHGNNLMYLLNKYMDAYKKSGKRSDRAKAEKYAKITSQTIIASEKDKNNLGANAYFYEAAEGLLTSVLLLVAEYCDPEERHIPTVYKVIQELMQSSGQKGKSRFATLLELLPQDHKARWFAGAAVYTSEQTSLNVISTALSRLNEFLDSEMEQIICYDPAIDAEQFVREKCAIFLILPEENPTTYFMASLFIQQLGRELISIADAAGGQLPKRAVFAMDEFGTFPKIASMDMFFSAIRSRRVQLIPIIQGYTQLYKNYGEEFAKVILDNVQVTLAGGFSPTSSTAKIISEALGDQTVMTGSVSKGSKEPSQTLSMSKRPLMSADELKTMPKGCFVVLKTGMHPFCTEFCLYRQWNIREVGNYYMEEQAEREISYGSEDALRSRISMRHPDRARQRAAAGQGQTIKRLNDVDAIKGLFDE